MLVSYKNNCYYYIMLTNKKQKEHKMTKLEKLAELAEKYSKITSLISNMEKEKNELKAVIKDYLQFVVNSREIEAGRYKVILTETFVKTLDTEALKTNEPSIYEEFLKETLRETLRVKQIK